MMKNKEKALHEFWNSFGIPAFEENNVPDNQPYPYITYNAPTDRLGNGISIHANIWYRSASRVGVIEKKEQILKRIFENGFATIPFDGGYIYIYEASPLTQQIDDSDSLIQRIYINLMAEYLCKY